MTDSPLYSLSCEQLEAAQRQAPVPRRGHGGGFKRIQECNDAVNAFVVLDPGEAILSAKASEARWARDEPLSPIDGVPTTLKDTMLAKGWPTLRGSKTTDPDGDWDIDAPPVARLREAGAVFLGKTTTPEFGWKG